MLDNWLALQQTIRRSNAGALAQTGRACYWLATRHSNPQRPSCGDFAPRSCRAEVIGPLFMARRSPDT
jgi:hypothetical protein